MYSPIKILVAALLLEIYSSSDARICLSQPRCYCSTKKSIKILCKNVTDVTPIEGLLEQFPRIYSLRIYGPNLKKIHSKVFSGRSMIILEVKAPLLSIPDEALSEIRNLQIVNFGGGQFSSVPNAFNNPTFKTVQLVNGMLSSIDNQLQNNTGMTNFLINDNKISKISSDALLNAESLQYLNLSNNELSYLDPAVFSHLPQLKSIDLGFNKLVTVDGCFHNLNPQEIILYGNNLSSVDNAFHRSMWSMKWLDLGGNPNLNISALIFVGSMPSLSVLSLNDNDMNEFDSLILKNFRSLHRLYINGNRLTVLQADFFTHTPYMSILELANNHLTSTEDLFPLDDQRPSIHTLKTVRLDGNKIRSIQLGGTSKSVLHLDLSRNQIKNTKFGDLDNSTSVSVLNLSSNPLIEVQTGCFRNQLRLRTLDLSSTNLKSLNRSVQNLVDLEHLIVESSSLTFIEEDELAGLNDLEFLSLRNNSLTSIYRVMQNLSNLSTLDVSENNLTTLTSDSLPSDGKGSIILRKLWMANNPWSCDCRLSWIMDWLQQKHSSLEDEPTCHLPPDLNGTKIRSLNLTNLKLWKEDCPEECDCNCEPDGNEFYTTINCTNRGLTDIPKIFPSNAREIYLQNNRITSLEGLGLEQFQQLRILNLEDNKLENAPLKLKLPNSIRMLKLAGNNMTRFPVENWSSTFPKLVTLSRNPWICDCDAWNFRLWLTARNNSVEDLSEVRCGDSSRLKNYVIVHLTIGDLCLTWRKTNITVIATFVTLLLLACLICYFFRKILVICCYSCGCYGLKASEKHDFSFDAFLLYADEDEDFALGVIADGLEIRPPGYRLFIPTRHIFLTSSPVNIESSLTDCCKVIILLSRDFVKNAQCMQLLKASMSCSIENTVQRMIFITKEKGLSVIEMDPVLSAVMRNSTHLRWGQFLFWQKLKYYLPKKNEGVTNADEDLEPFSGRAINCD